MSAPAPAAAGAPLPADASAAPDVETTNWNAVKLLATKYGIHLRSYEDEVNAHNAAAAAAAGGAGADAAAPSLSTGLGGVESTPAGEEEEQDLGLGTPFRITAKRIEGGRIIYRFKYRGEGSNGLEATPSPGGMPRSGSESVALSRLQGLNEPSSPSSKMAGGMSSLGRKQTGSNKALKGSKSIPSLRGMGMMGMTSGFGARAAAANSASSNAAASSATTNKATPAAAAAAGAFLAAPSSVASGAHSTPLSRAMSSPNPGMASNDLHSGDVLGAILGLRDDATERTAASPHSAAHASPPGRNVNAPPSAWRMPSPFGQHIVTQQQQQRSRTPLALAPVPVSTSGSWQRSPIPQVSGLGQPLFAEGSFPGSSSPSAEETEEEPKRRRQMALQLGPAGQHLREAQSFESADSSATARASDERVRFASHYPPALLPHLGISLLGEEEEDDGEAVTPKILDPSTFIFDVLQHYTFAPHDGAASSAGADSKRSSLAASFSSGSREASPSHTRTSSADVSSEPRMQGQAHSLSASAMPGDDPRFALWAMHNPDNEDALMLCTRNGSLSSPTSPGVGSPAHNATFSASMTGSTGRRWSIRAPGASGGGSASEAGAPSSSGGSSAGGRARSGSRPGRRPSVTASGLFSPLRPFLIAATPTRLIAELTSEIDNRLLTDFFYTYRTFMEPSELLRLLTLRFRWAMAPPVSPSDEARRRIVRVRTYVVLKHWLMHFFEVDFLPCRALRRQLTDWLNELGADPRLPSRPADASIVRSLKKLVRGLKTQYESLGMGGLLLHDAGRVASAVTSPTLDREKHTSTSSGHDSVHSPSGSEPMSPTSPRMQEDVDLDFSDGSGPESTERALHRAARQTRRASASTPGQRASIQLQMAGSSSPLVMEHPTLDRQHRHTLGPSALSSSIAPPTLPTSQNAISRVFVNTVGRISRFKRVLGSRAAIPSAFPGAGDVSGFEGLEFEANDSGDLLFIRGGLENFISFFNLRHPDGSSAGSVEQGEGGMDEDMRGHVSSDSTAQDETPSLSAASAQTRSTPASSLDLTPEQVSVLGGEVALSLEAGLGIEGAGLAIDDASALQDSGMALDAANLRSFNEQEQQREHKVDHLHHMTSEQTLRSVSTAVEAARIPEAAAARRSMMSTRNPNRFTSQSMQSTSRRLSNRPNIVQIDDIDLSSDEDDGVVRRALRRLPGARDLRMAQHVHDLEPAKARLSFDSMSNHSFSIINGPASHASHTSLAQGYAGSVYAPSISSMSAMQAQRAAEADREPIIGTVHTEMLDPDEALAGYELVRGFRLEEVDSDDEEPGDVEAALRRLEGVIDEDKQREKAKRVERMWLESVARKAAEDAGEAPPAPAVHPADAQADDTASVEPIAPASIQVTEEAAPRASVDELDALFDAVSGSQDSKFANQRSPAPPAPSVTNPTREQVQALNAAARPGLAAASKRQRSQRPSSQGNLLGVPSAQRQIPAAKFEHWQLPPVHRSFLLGYTSEVIAQQMCLIEAELFKALTWEELASDQWKNNAGEVLDWETFYQSRVRAKSEAQQRGERHTEAAVHAIVARFNLTCNWVASEILLTQNLEERAAVVAKFIRVAFKCYQQSNFASLAQIVFALQSPWVERLRRTWAKVGMWELRVLRDLKSFTSPLRNFRLMRNAMRELLPDAGIEDVTPISGRTAGSAPSGATAKGTVSEGCIPFIGLILSDLSMNDSRHSLIDPSSPSSAADIKTGPDGKVTLQLADPHAFDHLAPLPAGIELKPLVNLYKARMNALIIKTVLAFQQRARLYTYEADATVYVKVLKIRCLDADKMTQISRIAEP